MWLYRLNTAERQPKLLAGIHRLERSISEQKIRERNGAVESGEQSDDVKWTSTSRSVYRKRTTCPSFEQGSPTAAESTVPESRHA
jgi:hypothetical protein